MHGIRAQGARASTTRSRRHAVFAKTSRLANTQTKAGTPMQVQSTRKQHRHAVQAPGLGEMRPTRMVDNGTKECSLGIKSGLVAEDFELFSNLQAHNR